MAILKGPVQIWLAEGGRFLGTGQCYLHLPEGPAGPAREGTIPRPDWSTAASAREGDRLRLVFSDGRWVETECLKYGPTGCGPDILRFRAVGRLRAAPLPATG